jgi:hypothetical protein
MATVNFDAAKTWYEKMKQETAHYTAELDMYKLRGVTAAAEQMTALKNLNEVSTFYGMSGEAEFVKKRFFPFGTKGSKADKLKCDELITAAGDKPK